VPFTGVDHVGFTVVDLDRSIEWYTRFLEQEPILRKVWDVEYISRVVGYPNAKLDCALWRLPNGMLLELIQYLEPPVTTVDIETYNAGNGHLCLTTGDLQADFDRLRGHGEFRYPEPIEIPWGPYKGGRLCYLRDPDGISIELIELAPGGPAI
jgi:catechol 2,3-dioxygenase-like lactoylglutathione lyase family enzyme